MSVPTRPYFPALHRPLICALASALVLATCSTSVGGAPVLTTTTTTTQHQQQHLQNQQRQRALISHTASTPRSGRPDSLSAAKVERVIPTAHDAGDDEHGDQLMVDAERDEESVTIDDNEDEPDDIADREQLQQQQQQQDGDHLDDDIVAISHVASDRSIKGDTHDAYPVRYADDDDIPAQLVGDSVIEIKRRRPLANVEHVTPPGGAPSSQQSTAKHVVRFDAGQGTSSEKLQKQQQRRERNVDVAADEPERLNISTLGEDFRDVEEDDGDDDDDDDLQDGEEGSLEDRLWSTNSLSLRQRTNVLLAAA